MTTPLSVQPLSNEVCASPQLSEESMGAVAEAGFLSLINNRPDQPTSQALEAAAHKAGLKYAFVPVVPGRYTPSDVEQMAHLLATLPKPILLFCRSGARSSHLHQLATQA